MADMDDETRKQYMRGYPEADDVEKQATGEALQDVTMFDLISAFKKVLQDIERKKTVHHVEKVEVTTEQQTEYVLETLQQRGRQSFRELCEGLKNKMYVVVTFLAVLEMIKEQQINLFLQDDPTHFYLDLKPVSEIISA